MSDASNGKSPERSRWLRILRRLAIGVSVAVIAMTALRTATGEQLDDALERLGQSLSQAAPDDGLQRVELNGLDIDVVSAIVDAGVADTLDRVERECHSSELRPVRRDDGSRGFVACLAGAGDGAAGLVSAGWNTLFGDGAAGIRRYLYAELRDQGTFVVELVAASPLALARLVPKSGDAPGFDLAGVPRPTGADRWMSFREHGYDYQSVVYGRGELDPVALVEDYADKLRSRGYQVYTPWDLDIALSGQGRVGPGAPPQPTQPTARHFEDETFLWAMRGDAVLFLAFADDCDGSCTVMISSNAEIFESL